jgi:hypothetical protein
MNTIADMFKKQYPKEAKKLEKENCWDYRIFGPMGFYDLAEVLIKIQWEKGGKWYDYKVDMVAN